MEKKDEEINIGADPEYFAFSDDEQLISNNHEDAAFDYTVSESTSSNQQSQCDNSLDTCKTSINGRSNDVSSARSPRTVRFSHGGVPIPLTKLVDGEESVPREVVNEGLKAKQKEKEKKKAKKAAGWQKSDDMEGHVKIEDVDEVLDYVGEKDNNRLHTNFSFQKKKLRKKSKNAANGNLNAAQSTCNGKRSSESSCSDKDSDEENMNKNDVKDKLAQLNGFHSHHSNTADKAVLIAADYSMDNDAEGEFTEVHRKKKLSHKQLTTTTQQNKVGVPNPKNKALKLYSNTSKNNECKSSNMLQTQPKSAAVVISPQQPNVDLSLNSFPALESQFLDRNLPVETVVLHADKSPTSLVTDKEPSLKTGSGSASSWAKIAAKPTSVKSLPQDTGKSNADIIPSSQVVDLNAELSVIEQQSAFSKCSDNVNRRTSAPMQSISTSLCIEFGTVTSSMDLQADQQVHNILTQSYTEGQSMFNCIQPRTSVKTNKLCSHLETGVKHFTKNKPNRSKGVEFYDKQSRSGVENRPVNIYFGFDEDSKVDILPKILASTTSERESSSVCSSNVQDKDMLATLQFLNDEWNKIMQLRKKHGTKYALYYNELPK